MRRLLSLVPLILDCGRIITTFFSLRVAGCAPIVFFDLDNTLADSWPTLVTEVDVEYARDSAHEFRRLESLQPLFGTIDLYNEVKKMPVVIVVCTVRHDCFQKITTSWLRKHIDPEFGLTPSRRVVLVSTPYSKLVIWILLHLSRVKLFIIDDLSYNHERGVVYHFDKIKGILRRFGLRHLTFPCITQLNGDVRREAVKQRLEEIQSVLFSS
jgi:hypothetical protein